MAIFADARIPITVLTDDTALPAALAGRSAAVLAEAPPPAMPEGAAAMASFDLHLSSHAAACTCCGGRSAVAVALDRLFLGRVRGDAPWFDRVVALLPGEEAQGALAAALRDDGVVSSRFRADEGQRGSTS